MENKTFTTTNGVKVTVKPYVTGRQVQSLNDGIDPALPVEKKNIALSNKSIELLVVSVNEQTEDLLNTVLDLPFADYQEILETINAIIDPKKNATTTPTT